MYYHLFEHDQVNAFIDKVLILLSGCLRELKKGKEGHWFTVISSHFNTKTFGYWIQIILIQVDSVEVRAFSCCWLITAINTHAILKFNWSEVFCSFTTYKVHIELTCIETILYWNDQFPSQLLASNFSSRSCHSSKIFSQSWWYFIPSIVSRGFFAAWLLILQCCTH